MIFTGYDPIDGTEIFREEMTSIDIEKLRETLMMALDANPNTAAFRDAMIGYNPEWIAALQKINLEYYSHTENIVCYRLVDWEVEWFIDDFVDARFRIAAITEDIGNAFTLD
jgi:hypothetical protein